MNRLDSNSGVDSKVQGEPSFEKEKLRLAKRRARREKCGGDEESEGESERAERLMGGYETT